MIFPESSVWNPVIECSVEEMEKDEEGIRSMKILGVNLAWLIYKIGGERGAK